MGDDMIGHNGGPTFDDIVRDNIDRGLLLTMKETIVTAVRDPRLDRRHLRVLAEVISAINNTTGQAYPSRETIAKATRRYETDGVRETQGYSESGISKTLSELVAFGYLISTKRAVERGGRALSIYSIRKPTIEDLQDEITKWIEGVRQAPPKRSDFTYGGKVTGKDRAESAVFTPVGNVTGVDVTPEGKDRAPDVTPVGNVTPVGKDRADFTSDFTYVVPTVTRLPELGERTDSQRGGASASQPPIAPALPPVPAYPSGNGGEDHKGHGVYLNGETIRHSAFAISLAGIRMNTINSGLSANEVTNRCLAHALQWAVEIENGLRPEKVLPTKIANFLARSIMGEVNQQKIQGVREAKVQQPYAGGARQPSTAGDVVKIETRAERLARMAAEIETGSKT